jgi:hypothetical protein
VGWPSRAASIGRSNLELPDLQAAKAIALDVLGERTFAVSVPGMDAHFPRPVALPPHHGHHGALKPLAFSWAAGPPPSGGVRKAAIRFGIHDLDPVLLDAYGTTRPCQ